MRKKLNQNKQNPELIVLEQLQIREYKASDRYSVFQILNDYRRDYFILIYKNCFKSWFSYAFTATIMAITYTLLHRSILTLFVGPLIITTYILYRVNKYRRTFKTINIYDIESFVLESTSLRRRQNHGAYVCLLEEKIVAYCVYIKDKDELNAVRIKEVCVDQAYRKSGVCKYFLRHLCDNVFKTLKFDTIVFTLSNFHPEMKSYCVRHNIKMVDYWQAFYFLPGVLDQRTAYHMEF